MVLTQGLDDSILRHGAPMSRRRNHHPSWPTSRLGTSAKTRRHDPWSNQMATTRARVRVIGRLSIACGLSMLGWAECPTLQRLVPPKGEPPARVVDRNCLAAGYRCRAVRQRDALGVCPQP
jgi:hypothetical protein